MRGIGVDFGTANSMLATFDGKSAEALLADGHGHPSLVWYQKRRQPRVGTEAKDAYSSLLGDPDHAFIKSVKRRLASDDTVTLATRTISTETATEVIFNFLLKEAKISPEQDDRFVIAIPNSLTRDQRKEIMRAAKAAGFSPSFLVSEPLAALVGYLEREPIDASERRRVVVADWGAGNVEIALVIMTDDCLVEVASCSLDDVAGDDIDALLAEEALKRFMKRNGLSRQKLEEAMPGLAPEEALLSAAEQAKIALSSDSETQIAKAGFCSVDGVDYDIEESFSKAEFEDLIRPIVDRVLQATEEMLSSAGAKPSDIDLCLLIGESTNLPPVVEGFGRLMTPDRIVRPSASSTLIAEGAAIMAYRNCIPRLVSDISLLLADGSEHELIPAGTAMTPKEESEAPEEFICVDPRQGKIVTAVRANPSVLSSVSDICDRSEHLVELEIDYVQTYRVYNLPRLFVAAGFDETCMLRIDFSSSEAKAEEGLEVEAASPRAALFNWSKNDDGKLDSPSADACRVIPSPTTCESISNILPITAGKRRIWASVPVELLIELEPEIRDVRLMEKYLTPIQRDEYLNSLSSIPAYSGHHEPADSACESDGEPESKSSNG